MKLLYILLSAFIFTYSDTLSKVKYIDIKKAAGKWYEIARMPTWFSKNCQDGSITFTMRSDGDIDILSEADEYASGLKTHKSTTGRGKFIDHTKTRMRVNFTPEWLPKMLSNLLNGECYIAALDEENYNYMVLVDVKKSYLWILCREHTMDDNIYQELLSVCKSLGFDIEQMLKNSELKYKEKYLQQKDC